MAKQAPGEETRGSAFRAGPPSERTPLRDYLEYVAVLILIVLLLRQVVVEAFKIRHGSMAPTLVGVHNEVRCPNCGWVFSVGRDKVGYNGQVECPNCRHFWEGAAGYDESGEPLTFPWPVSLRNSARAYDGSPLPPQDAANRVYRGASRIFVNKFIYSLRKPRRWEVIVFLYPLYSLRCTECDWRGQVESLEGAICPDCGGTDFEVGTKNFIKRVVGLPGEIISLRDGDVYVDGALARKAREVQERLWFHVFDSKFLPRREVVPTWDLGESPRLWQRRPPGAALMVDARGAAGPVLAAFGRPIVDFYAYDGPSFATAPRAVGAPGRHRVGDCRIRARVRPLAHAPDGEVLLEIEDGGHRFTLSARMGARGGLVLRDDGVVVGQVDLKGLPLQEPEWLALENYDDRVVAKVGGGEVLSYEYRGSPGGSKGVRFGAREAQVLWERVVVERDIYYENAPDAEAGAPVYKLDEGEYFVLGDNSPASSDSRRWGMVGVPQGNLVGKAFFVFWPVHQMKLLAGGPRR
ncbi:MAG: S26 family signal peptidase [Planctomycetota bacterium]